MSDNYEYEKSLVPQGLEQESPYSDKQYSFINDINGGIYQSSGLCQVNFDCTSICNNANAVNPPDTYGVVPLVITSAYVSNTTTGALVTPTASTSLWASTGLKSGYWQLIHSGDIMSNGVQLEQSQQFTNVYVNFKLLSQMCQDDLNSFGTTLGMGDKLDNVQSMRFNGSGNMSLQGGTLAAYPSNTISGTNRLQGGNGLVNNSPFPSPVYATTQNVTTAQTAAGVTLTMTTTTGILIGQLVSGTDIAYGSIVVQIVAGASITLSISTTAAVPVNTALYFITYLLQMLVTNLHKDCKHRVR
jgi:hypothetical protein